MDLSNCSDSLLEDPSLQKLPEELLEILRNGSNEQYLDTLSSLALRPAHTTTIFFAYEPLAPELCSRWLPKPETDDLSALAALASILPSAPYLSPYVRALLSRQRGVLGLLASLRVMTLYELPLETLHKLLLALFRLLEFDNESFAPDVSPAQLQVLFRHDNPSIRYLAIRIMCLYLHASDAALVSMIGSYIGGGEIPGPREDQTIDFTFFSLWEKKRLNDIDRISQGCRNARFCNEAKHQDLQSRRIIEIQDLSVTVACIGGTLVPRLHGKDVGLSSIVMTETTGKNMRSLAEGINTSKPLLVTGSSGVGKTSMIRDVARELGKGSSMVTLYLNEQTDAKLLVGMYTSAKASDSFKWRPGVLTTAVLEGRWVLIEDLDRAPKEIVSTLLPLLERGELLVPNWGQSVRAAPGFKLIATVRSATNVHGEESMPIMGTIGLRHWLQVSLDTPPDEQLAEIIIHRFPLVRAFLPQFMNVYHTLRYPDSAKILDRAVNINFTRPVGPQDLLKWCGRVHSVLSIAGKTTGAEPVSDAIGDCIFLEAIDCFIGAYPPGSQKTICAESIAQGLHMPAERATYCLEARKPEFSASDSLIRVGRAVLMKSKKSRGSMSSQSFGNSPFATTTYVTRLLESVAAAVNRAEPCLLVGETGTGKTTIVQRLANAMEHKLTVVNLSQQSESGDLLGGYKPVNLRALAVPMKEEFDELLGLTFNSTKNRPFIDALGKLVSKGRWAKVLLLWQDALRMIDDRFKPLRTDTNDVTEEPQSKKRRLQSPKFRKLMSRWDKFSSDVQIFQNHLSSGPRGFAFSFVEGNVVKAARNGEWVLLDEINLASPDTLESLADLFSPAIDGGASILLTESGDTQRIYAHENFRIFGAMNPATDIGKRDLPTSLRSRFTEIFIAAPDQDLENLVSIVRVYLGNHQHLDVRAATDIAHLYLNIQELVRENRLVDGANQKPHFSLRTLTRTLVYVLDIAPMYGLRRAIFEGFSMSFVTVLDKQSELCLRPLIEKHIMSAQKNSKAFLNQTPRLPKDGKNYVQFKQYWVAQGARPIERQLHYIITPFIERNLLSLVRATSTRRFPVLLQGPTSSGKTSMIEYLARISGNKFVRINNHEHTDLQEYLGTYVSGSDGRLQYQEGVLVHALREGYWVVLDELNLAPTDVLEALNRLLDDNRELLIPETQQVVKPHENFMLFATQNPPGMYGGRKVLSRAFRNRFLELHFDDIPEDELETILRERSQIAPSFCTKIVTVYKRLSILRQSERLFEQKNSFATLRDLFRWALRNADDRGQLAINGFLLLAERVRNQEERLALKSIIEDVMKVKVEEVKLYNVAKLENTLGAQIHSSHSIVWTKSMLRLWVLVTEALKNKEPVLLVGETGSGKTTICQFIAEMTGTKLHIVNAHQNMETSDLIGAQRPTRNKAYTESQLSQYLITALKLCDSYAGDNVHDLPELLRIYENLGQKVQASLPEQCRLAIEDSRIRLNSMFEWADGSLVTAMRKGDHFLLDEISLADDSVLERLNSILEPGRTLFLAEKGTDDDPLTAAPGFQFLATMNPGGDYGKRELSPALRNRFTEIWVPSVTSEEEMLQVLQAKLAPQFLAYSKPMVAFAAWYSSSYNIAAPYISIRDLLSWAQFTNDFQHPDSNLRLLHGAAMVYIDGLGANPASKTSISDTAASKERQACISKLDDLFGQDLSSLYNKSCDLWSDNEALNVGPFSLAKVPGSREDHIYSFQAPTTMSNALKIVRALQLKKPILIEGSPGVGKTTLVAALAHAIGMPLTRINLSDQTDLMDLFGSDVPVERSKIGLFHWRDAPFLRAMRKGEWVLLDEMNLASQSVLEGLNACLDHRGQVYIPELDQLFERHPNFVVFAAQNPHHQGGGRKGLPTSFVNRFTVVYAESFNLEDLMLISNEMFPTVPHDDREKIVRSISVMSQMLRDNRRLEAHGGPWEVNLRDALRWLHLLTAQKGLMPFARPAHYEQLLLLQRFRTSEDVAAVSKVLQREFPQDQPRSYFHGKCTGLLEVGLGLLPRAPTLQPILSSAIIVDKIDLAIAESAMLCVQNNWPCLLVGASGCGKSSLVRQLASAVGADILEISLNSEMDTTDLIGGYEQIDPRRNLVTFIDQLREHARRSMIWELKTEEEFNEEMTALLAQLQSPNVDPAEIMPYIEDVSEAEGQRRSDFATFLARGKYLLSQDKVDNRARFEWVNGILVKGLTQGKWVILDNANLCNPSVLDRLNSLLEPDGFLSINEHRNPDGSARVVHPHKDFRLFLTMDPRHGELSRAMRNRSIELFMQSECQSPSSEVLSSCSESTVSRFGLFQAFDWNSLDDSRFKFTLSIFFDHLTSNDIRKCHRWEAQIQKGLVSLSPPKNLIFSLVLRTYRWMFDHDGSTLNGISRMYEMIDGKMSVSLQGFASMQTIHPFNSPHLLSSTDQNTPSSNLRWLGSCFEVLLEIYDYIQELSSVDQRLYFEEKSSQWTCLERSMISLRSTRFRTDATQPLATFLQEMGLYLRHDLETKNFDDDQDPEGTLMFIRDVLTYLRDISVLAQSPDFDGGEFQAYQAIGRSMSTRASTNESTTPLALQLGCELNSFNCSWQLSSGIGMVNIWTVFRPKTAIDTNQLEFSLRIKGLADQFDTLKFSSGASLRELESLQSSIVQIHGVAENISPLETNPLTEVQEALDDLQRRSDLSKAAVIPFFQSQFEVLYQYAARSDTTAFMSFSPLRLLAGSPTRNLMNFGCNTEGWNTLSQLQNLTVTSDRNSELAHVREILPISILQKLENTSEVPLRSLDLLYTELDVVATVLAASTKEIQKKPLDHLLHLLRSLHNAASQALDSTSRADIQRGIRKRSHRNGHSRISADEQIEHLDRCLEDVLKLQDNEKISTCGGELEEYTNAASRFIRFFTSCLLLFVPDRPFDPALRPMVEQKRHNNRKAELKAKLVALQDFEMVFSGQATSFRINLIEQDLRALGPEPEVLQVTRPQISELTQLQAEYNNILNDIVARSPDTATLQRTYEGQNPQSQETKLTRANIAQAVSRLSHNFHAYEDITKPLIAMLQGLDVGLALALLANARKDPIQDATKFICERTPFLGATPVSFINDSLADLQTTPTSQPDSRPHFLKRVAIIRSVSQLSEPSHQSTMFQAFHSHYEEWKEQLSQDQRHSAAQSSLYRYRGNEEVSDGMDEEDFRSLFPTSDNPSEEGLRQTKSEHGPRQQAQQLSQLHREIFQIDRPTSVRMLGLLRDASHCIAELWQDQSSMSTSPVPADRLLSALVLSLSEKKDSLHGKATDSHLYNFYTDANFLEAQNLINLVHRVQARFTEVQEVWPEHATLTDVLKTSSELLALRNIEPVAKLLTKTEQLLGYLHEWQTVASKQYTAITLYDELTKLLVNWRRLELSTWARLLDMEDKKCYDDADAWWFIAYETIIAAPLALINNGEKVEGHTEHLFSTLSEFLTSTSMGQYTHRLGMIACFKSYLEALEQDVPAIRVVRNAIANFVNYYSHFNGPIRQFLLKGRESLEKDMKEVLLLASWKDTNINALRDSAKRSHHKLFKVVRKYRTLLSQPSEIVIRQGIPQQTKPSCTPTSKSQSTETLTTNSRAIQVCQDSLTNWWQKPERFTNAAATAWRMLSMSQLPSTKVDVTSILDHLGGNLINSMKALKRETPSKATKENEGLIKHLKARKRKLYADTLKMMRRMGFRSNINADALAKQSSLAVILTSCPVLGNGLGGDDGNAAEYHFQMILNLLPQAKERAKQHSEDLTHGEVVKSFGYLESMVSMILKQRAVLADAIIDLEDFTTAVKTVRNLWAPDSYAVRKWDNQEAARADGMKYVLGWLPGIIEAGSVIIEKHGKLGATSHSTILDGLAIWRKRISAALEARDSLPDLPPTLTSSKHEQMITEEELLLQGFRADLQLLIDTNLDIDFVLTQIQMWTNPPIKDVDHQLGAEQIHDLKALDDSVSSSLDSILVTHQQMQEALLSMPTSDDDPEWLLQVEQSLTAGLKGLHVREISRILKDNMSKLHLMDCKGENDLYVAGALLAAAIPIIQQHRNVHHIALARYLRFHRSLCELASVLVTAFSEIVLSGFCSPSEAEGAESGNLEKLEGGTGLGEGEGAEDISKDVEDDEDISELAQQKGDDKKEEELEAQDEAVNMDHDDLEGETGENSDRGEDDGSANEDEGNDVDEQTGSVDNLDPSAVDEKLWDGNAEETEKEKSGSKSEGKAEKDENIAADSTAQQENGKNDESEDEDEVNEEGAEEGEEITNEESEKTDPHAREGQNLDLPEEIDLDNKDGNEEELESGDSEIDAMSAPDQEPDRDDTATEPDADQESDALDEIAEPRNAQADSLETDGESNDGEAVGSPVDTEPSDDQADDDQGLLKNRSDDATVDRDNSVPSDARGLGEDMDQQSDGEQEPANQAQARKGEKRSAFDQDDPEAVAKDGQSGPSKERSEENQTQEKPQAENSSTQALKRLGDALEKWHRQNKQIEDAADQDVYTQQPAKDMDMADQDFEHLRDDQVEADTQAMGAATDEQARALDHEALDSELPNNIRDFPPEDASPEEANDSDEVMEDIDTVRNDTETKQKQSWPSALVANNAEVRRMHDQRSAANAENEEDIKDLDLDLSSTHLQPADRATSRSAEEARNLWSHYESITRGLSFSLTEQLRLILAPTLATKMRGDFRTGKRLNIKRIIPYIASQYKRDKIWMRRSIPSKRNYQIMLAVDDSKSMGESGSGQLAFETLALVAKSLSMLEVGQICVVGFGNEVRVAHDFDKPFSSEAGAQIFQHFGFQQTKTNVRKLVADSIALFREARRKTFNAGTDLWQLELIISDGVCEDHDTIRRLVRQAQEERIMIVFVIVDALLKNESIMDMSQAVFEPDETGDTKLKIKRYLDDFPFPYYLVVGDVKDLPGVLAQALRQWFAEVVESG